MAARCRGWRCTPETMKRYLPFIIIVAVLAGAIAVAFIMVRRGGGTSQTNSTFIAANEAAPPNKNVTAPTPFDSVVTKPNVKVSSPVDVEEYGNYQFPQCC